MAKKKFGEQPKSLDELDRFNHELLPQICDKITGAKFHLDNGPTNPAEHRRAKNALTSCARDCEEAKTLVEGEIEAQGRKPGEGL